MTDQMGPCSSCRAGVQSKLQVSFSLQVPRNCPLAPLVKALTQLLSAQESRSCRTPCDLISRWDPSEVPPIKIPEASHG